MNSHIGRFLFGFVTIFILLWTPLADVAADDQQPNSGSATSSCADCHEDYELAFANSPHMGKLECVACHLDAAGDHPKSAMRVLPSSLSCRGCHAEVSANFSNTGHASAGLECASCHNSHSTNLKFTVDRKNGISREGSQLCASCHNAVDQSFEHSMHAAQGADCLDCHIGGGQSPHSFAGDVQACSSCHLEEMHAGESSHTSNAGATTGSALGASPAPASPWGYFLLSFLFGTGLGLIAAPWLERGLRALIRSAEEVRHDH